ncbi:hypothetical protein [Cryobacterium sp. GrIS_2_6]|uniref:hypothetical protein n=1 Tax=Cryobacterium sp. GrIS_2_6 TaxID=3162785 RepID=UPI002E07E1A0|nr:hypothetical protein [Cryobacterium psychrotolerans]
MRRQRLPRRRLTGGERPAAHEDPVVDPWRHAAERRNDVVGVLDGDGLHPGRNGERCRRAAEGGDADGVEFSGLRELDRDLAAEGVPDREHRVLRLDPGRVHRLDGGAIRTGGAEVAGARTRVARRRAGDIAGQVERLHGAGRVPLRGAADIDDPGRRGACGAGVALDPDLRTVGPRVGDSPGELPEPVRGQGREDGRMQRASGLGHPVHAHRRLREEAERADQEQRRPRDGRDTEQAEPLVAQFECGGKRQPERADGCVVGGGHEHAHRGDDGRVAQHSRVCLEPGRDLRQAPSGHGAAEERPAHESAEDEGREVRQRTEDHQRGCTPHEVAEPRSRDATRPLHHPLDAPVSFRGRHEGVCERPAPLTDVGEHRVGPQDAEARVGVRPAHGGGRRGVERPDPGEPGAPGLGFRLKRPEHGRLGENGVRRDEGPATTGDQQSLARPRPAHSDHPPEVARVPPGACGTDVVAAAAAATSSAASCAFTPSIRASTAVSVSSMLRSAPARSAASSQRRSR